MTVPLVRLECQPYTGLTVIDEVRPGRIFTHHSNLNPYPTRDTFQRKGASGADVCSQCGDRTAT